MSVYLIVLFLLMLVFLAGAIKFVIWYKSLKRRSLDALKDLPNDQFSDWSTSFLANKRQEMDLLADATIQEIMEKGELAAVNQLFEMITKDKDQLPADAPQTLKAYFEMSGELPVWANQDLIALGQQIYIRHGIWVNLMLSYKSLPECYACASGAEVLYQTARLNEKHGEMNAFSRRIAETALFVVYAMTPGGLSIKGKGLRAIQKVRLIHAVIRYYLKRQGWDASKYGEPINQEDMAGTLMAFSALILEGLESIDIKLEEVEMEAYTHCWAIIGHLMGLQDDMIPHTSASASELGHAIFDHQVAKSSQGAALMDALLVFQNKKSQPILGEKSNHALMRFFMGKDISDMLDVPSVETAHIHTMGKRLKFWAWIAEKLDKSLVFSMVLQWITKHLSILMISRMTDTSIINFYIPKSLTVDWGISTPKNQRHGASLD